MFDLAMNLDQARIHLSRINRLFTDLTSTGDEPSALERDLLKEYIRKLYDAVDGHESTSTATQSKSALAPAQAAPASRLASRAPEPSFSFAPAPQVAMAAATPAIAPRPKPSIIKIPESVENEVKQMEQQQVQQTATRTTQAIPVAQIPVLESPFEPEVEELSPRLRKLFAVTKSGDLSDRLSGTPVSDLTKAFALNDRIEAQNTLFGGDKSNFDAALKHLNDLPDYESAITYLGGGVAKMHDWLDDEKEGSVKTFVKTVRRRYS